MPADTSNPTWADTERVGPIDYDKKAARKHFEKSQSHYVDPCQEFAERSIRCLHRNGNDKSFCNDYFQAYRDCKKQWLETRKEQRRAEGKWF